MRIENSNIKGVVLVVLSTIMWAMNGNVGSYLFKNKEITPEHLTMFRLIFAGLVLLIYQYFTNRNEMFSMFHNRPEVLRLVYFAFCGILAMQYGFFVAVKYSNAATATILQSLAPFVIVIITSITSRKLPSKTVFLALIFAFVGAFFLITHGKFNQLAITKFALLFGVIAAFGSINYNLSSRELQNKYSVILVIGWAMLISGVGFTLVFRPWKSPFLIDVSSVLGIIFVAAFGTLFPFLFYLMGAKIIGPQRASILSLIEPVASTIIAVVFMGAELVKIDFLGIGLVVFALLLLALPEVKRTKGVSNEN